MQGSAPITAKTPNYSSANYGNTANAEIGSGVEIARLRAFVQLLLETGLRIGDAVRLDWQRSLSRLFKLAAVPNACAHRFRHTFAKRLLMSGVPIERVAVVLGHSSPTITMKHYAQWIPERQEQLEADVRLVQQKFA